MLSARWHGLGQPKGQDRVTDSYHITVCDVTYVVPAELDTVTALKRVAIVNQYHPEGPATIDLLDPFGLNAAVLDYIATHGPTDLVGTPWPYKQLQPTIELLRLGNRIACIYPNGYTIVNPDGTKATHPVIVQLLEALAQLGPATGPNIARRCNLRYTIALHFLRQLVREGLIERDGDSYRFSSAEASSLSSMSSISASNVSVLAQVPQVSTR
jgi:hypothetical protein